MTALDLLPEFQQEVRALIDGLIETYKARYPKDSLGSEEAYRYLRENYDVRYRMNSIGRILVSKAQGLPKFDALTGKMRGCVLMETLRFRSALGILS